MNYLKPLLIATLLTFSGCLESTLKMVVQPDRTAEVQVVAEQFPSESLASRMLVGALGASALSIADRSAWENLPASLGKGVTLKSLDISPTASGGTRVDAYYSVPDIRTLSVGLGTAAPLLSNLDIGPAAWSYRFTWQDQPLPQLMVIPPRPRPQPGIISPREAMEHLGAGAALGERSLATLLNGSRIRLIIEAPKGLQNTTAQRHPRYADNEVLLLELDMDRLVEKGGFGTLLDIKDYEGLKQLYQYHPNGVFMQDPAANPRLMLTP